MNGKSLGMLGLAVVCGLGAMIASNKFLAKDKSSSTVEMQDVLVAARDLKIEEVIKPDVVKVTRMAKTAVPSGAFTSSKDVEDRWVLIGVLEGEPIIDRKLAPRGSPPGLVSRIPKGMRAFAIEVNEQTGVSGFVLPDHRVDVVQIEASVNGRPPEADTVLQDVLVLASGQTFTRPDDRSIQARTVTLALKPEQVDTLVAARSRGPLTLSLRGLNDHVQAPAKKKVIIPPPERKVEQLVVKAPEPPPPVVASPPPPPPSRFVTIYRGIDNMRRYALGQPPDLGLDALSDDSEPLSPKLTTINSAPSLSQY